MRHKLVRNGRWVGPDRQQTQRLLVEAWMEENMHGGYAAMLIQAAGRPMERALIRARQRYEKQKPGKIRAGRIHRAYRAKKK